MTVQELNLLRIAAACVLLAAAILGVTFGHWIFYAISGIFAVVWVALSAEVVRQARNEEEEK